MSAGKSLLLVALSATAVGAQVPDKFTNLKVLPKDIDKPELVQMMRGFSFSVGVRCNHCHAAAKGTAEGADGPLDFASDDKEAKRTARVMMQMVHAINHDHLSRLATPPPVAVDCVSCHRGLPQPRPVNAVVAAAIEKKGLPEALKLYRDLRKKYYGGAQYDFTETPLNQLGEALMAKDKALEAAAVMELNAELNKPLSGWAMAVMAMAHQGAGETDKAIADFRRALELNPNNKWAQAELDKLLQKKK